MVRNTPYSASENSHIHWLHGCTPNPPKSHPFDLPETAHQVWDEAQHLKQLVIQIIFHWIPSHIGIFGNEEADRLGNLATNIETVQTCEQTIGALGRQISKRIKIMTDKLYSDYYTTATATWYLSTTIPEHRICSNIFIDSQLRLLRCHSHSKSFKTCDKYAICNVCQSRFDLNPVPNRMPQTTEYSSKY